MFVWVLYCCFFIGVFLLCVSFFIPSSIAASYENFPSNKAADLSDSLSRAIDEAEDLTKGLEDYSSSVFSEMEGKYQELLFLYQMIEEKRAALSFSNATSEVRQDMVRSFDEMSRNIAKKEQEIESEVSSVSRSEKALSFVRPDYKEIVAQFESGSDVAEISKCLKIGQDEVRFVLRLAGF